MELVHRQVAGVSAALVPQLLHRLVDSLVLQLPLLVRLVHQLPRQVVLEDLDPLRPLRVDLVVSELQPLLPLVPQPLLHLVHRLQLLVDLVGSDRQHRHQSRCSTWRG